MIRARSLIPDPGVGTLVTNFRSGGGGDFGMFRRAAECAITNGTWPLIFPGGKDYDWDGQVLYLNADMSIAGGPLPGIRFVGPSTGAPGIIRNGVLWAGAGDDCVIDGDHIDQNSDFNSQGCFLEHFMLFGKMVLRCLQVGGGMRAVRVRPVAGLAPDVTRERGVEIRFCHTFDIQSLRVQNGGPTIDGMTIDTCHDIRLGAVGINANRKGLQILQEVHYDPPNPGGGGSTQSSVWGNALHLEGNYEEAACLGNIYMGDLSITATAPHSYDGTLPIIRAGHPTDPDQGTTSLVLGGRFRGKRLSEDAADDAGIEIDDAGIIAGSVGVEVGYIDTLAFKQGTRFRLLDTGVKDLGFATHFTGLDSAHFSKTNTPIGPSGSGRRYSRSMHGGITFRPTGRSVNAWNVGEIRVSEQYLRLYSYIYGDNTAGANAYWGKARGAADAPLPIVQNDNLMNLAALGYAGGDWRFGSNIRTRIKAANPGGSDMQSELSLRVVPPSSTTLMDGLTIDAGRGLIAFGASTPFLTPDSLLWAQPFTLATLPAASLHSGKMATVSDGASNKWLVRSDGTVWRYPDGVAV